MNEALKRKVDQSPMAERRGVYEFINNSGTYKGYCLVISGDHRKFDRYVSVIQLKSVNDDGAFHNDETGLRLPDGREFWIHCGMVTYLRRDLLGEKIHTVSKKTMKRVNKGIMQELGLSPKTDIIASDDDPDYENMYKSLIRTIAGFNNAEKPVKKKALRKSEV